MNKTIMAALCAVALLSAGCRQKTETEEKNAYAVLTVQRQDVTTINKYPATIRGRQDVDIYPQVSGRITRVCITEGQRVKKGQALFVIDQVPYRAALQTALANVSAARAEVATARLTLEGKKELRAARVVSDFEVQKAENALHAARAALQQAQAQLTEARNNLSYTVVSSPCEGVTGTIPYRVGALVGPTMESSLTTVSDNTEMYVYFSLPENNMLQLTRRYGSAQAAARSMNNLVLYLNDGSEYGRKGRIESISGVLDRQTGSVSLRAAFANEAGLLHSGGAGNVGLEEHREGVVVPQAATYELQDKVYVYRVVGGKAVATRIDAQPIDEKKIYLVRSGLKAGDVVVAEGVATLKDGSPITVKKQKTNL